MLVVNSCAKTVIPAEHEKTILGRIEGDYINNTQATITLEPVDMGSDPSSSAMISEGISGYIARQHSNKMCQCRKGATGNRQWSSVR